MKLLTIPEVADSMRVSESTVRRLIRRGLIAAYKVGDRVRVKEEELERYVESQRVPVAVASATETPANAESNE